MSLLNRLPRPEQIAPVYALGSTILYSWTLYHAIKTFSSNWSMFLPMGDIVSLFTYMLVGNFLESLILISALLVLCFILPSGIVKDRFMLRGSILTITFLGSIMIFYIQLSKILALDTLLDHINTWIIMFTASSLILLVVGERVEKFGKIIESIADRCVIFLYIYLPITLLSLAGLIFRNTG